MLQYFCMRRIVSLIQNTLICFGLLGLVTPVLALTPNDPLQKNQWYLQKIDAFSAWNQTTGSNDIVVAILDTGVDIDHPDLAANIWVNSGEIQGDGLDNDHNGFIDDYNGWDFVDHDASPIPNSNQEAVFDAVAHGTAIAGTIGAMGNNAKGITGLNWNIRLMPVRILDNFGSGTSENARLAVQYAVANGADVINLSFTGFEIDPLFRDEIRRAYMAGVVVVAAVGNESNGGINLNETPIYPACFQDEMNDWVIGVAATDKNDLIGDFSNYGSVCTDIAAPGVGITGLLYQDEEWVGYDQLYGGIWSGTSIAAPMVAGAAALLKSIYPTLNPSQIKIILQLSVDPVLDRHSPAVGQVGAGRLNLSRAIKVGASFAGDDNSVSVDEKKSVVSAAAGDYIAVAAESGKPIVKVYDFSGQLVHSFLAYDEKFLGGVRLAMGDVDGDGQAEIVTVPGKSGGPHVRIFELDGTLVGQFFAFDAGDTFGLYVATGDVDGDRVEEIIVGSGAGGQGWTNVFEVDGTKIASLQPAGFTIGGTRVAAGDINGDGIDEIISSGGKGDGSAVTIVRLDGTQVASFYAYAPSYNSGIFVNAGDINQDGIDEIITGTDNGGGPHVRIFDMNGKVLQSFFADDKVLRNGVQVAISNFGSDINIVTMTGSGSEVNLRVFDFAKNKNFEFLVDHQTNRNRLNLAAWSK